MILKKEDQEQGKPTIDLTGPDGNAFALMGYAKQWSRDLGHTPENAKFIQEDMKSGDYEHLLNVIEENFGEYVIMLR